jgi:hypothetical protein
MQQKEDNPSSDCLIGTGLAGTIVCSLFFYDMHANSPESTDQCTRTTLMLLFIAMCICFSLSALTGCAGILSIKYSDHTLKLMETACRMFGTVCICLILTAGAYSILPVLLHGVVLFHHYYVIDAGLVTLPVEYSNTENDRQVAGEWSFAIATVIVIFVWIFEIYVLCNRMHPCTRPCTQDDTQLDEESGFEKLAGRETLLQKQ